jgi:hypothetical protein
VLPHPRLPAKNRVTGKQIDRFSGDRFFVDFANPLILKDFQKLARHLLYLWHNKNKNVTPNKNNR